MEKVCYNRGVKILASPSFETLEKLYESRRGLFETYKDLLRINNEKFNLTAISDEKEIFVKHFLDSLAGVNLFLPGSRVAEVGSGAGFPSIPLMIARPDLVFALFESTAKKCAFLEEVIRTLELPAEVYCMRAEDAAQGRFRECYDISCARAVARLDTLAEYCMPLVKKGGTFIAYKGADSELEVGENAIRRLGGTRTQTVEYDLPEGFGHRTLVVVRKGANTPEKYPRGRGMERKNPL